MSIDRKVVQEVLSEAGIDHPNRVYSISYAEDKDETLRTKIPDFWQKLYLQSIDNIIDSLWENIYKATPLTIEQLKSKTLDIFFIENNNERFLLYLFVEDGIYSGFRGNPAIEILPYFATNLSIDLSIFYHVHNGWYEISSNEGMLRVEDFELFYDQEENKPNFLKIFAKGVNCIGFDIDSTDKLPYALWVADDEVEEIKEFWQFIDEWIATILEEFDAREEE